MIYQYPAEVLTVHDGDTLHLDVNLRARVRRLDADLGFSTYVENGALRVHEDFRLYGINAPELSAPDGSGVRSLAHFVELLSGPSGKFMPLIIRTYKQGSHERQEKYGRWLVSLWVAGQNPDTVRSINDRMVADGFAVPYLGGAR